MCTLISVVKCIDLFISHVEISLNYVLMSLKMKIVFIFTNSAVPGNISLGPSLFTKVPVYRYPLFKGLIKDYDRRMTHFENLL